MARLGDLLVADKLVTSAQLAEALEAQVLHGGRLGTNLVELGFLEEKVLAKALGRQHQLAFASGEMVPDPKALTLADPKFLETHDVMPMRLDGTKLMVAIVDPREIAALDQLGFQTGKRIVPAVIPEFRMNQLLRKHCKSFRPVRPIDMNTLRPSKQAAKAAKAAKAAAAAPVEDLINEDDFAKLYAKVVTGQTDGAAQAEPPMETIEGIEVVEEPPLIEATIAAPRATAPWGAAAENRPQPLTYAEAQERLRACTTREQIAEVVLRSAISTFQRAILFSVQGDLLTGWHGAGVGVRDQQVKRIGVFLRDGSTFKLVRDTRAHYVGPMKADGGTNVLYKLLGGGYPKTAVLLPLLVRGKVVNMLYVDQGPGELTPPEVSELLIISQAVARSFEALISAAAKA